MSFEIHNLQDLKKPNHYLAIKTKNNKEVLTVEHKQWFGRLWRLLGFGNAAVAKIFKFLENNPAIFKTIKNDRERIFLDTLIKYRAENQKTAAKIASIINLVPPSLNITDQTYNLSADEFYNRWIAPYEQYSSIKKYQEQIEKMALKYFQKQESKGIDQLLLQANTCPKFAKYFKGDFQKLGHNLTAEKFSMLITRFPNIQNLNIRDDKLIELVSLFFCEQENRGINNLLIQADIFSGLTQYFKGEFKKLSSNLTAEKFKILVSRFPNVRGIKIKAEILATLPKVILDRYKGTLYIEGASDEIIGKLNLIKNEKLSLEIKLKDISAWKEMLCPDILSLTITFLAPPKLNDLNEFLSQSKAARIHLIGIPASQVNELMGIQDQISYCLIPPKKCFNAIVFIKVDNICLSTELFLEKYSDISFLSEEIECFNFHLMAKGFDELLSIAKMYPKFKRCTKISCGEGLEDLELAPQICTAFPYLKRCRVEVSKAQYDEWRENTSNIETNSSLLPNSKIYIKIKDEDSASLFEENFNL